MVSEENANQEVISQQEENTPSPGAMLKARREKLGLSQQDIADKLFLKSKQINDLESDIIDEKSSVTFTKGYVRNYAKQLGMNSHEVIEAFERYHNQTSVPSSEKLQSFSKRVAKQTHDDRWMMVTYVILLLIIHCSWEERLRSCLRFVCNLHFITWIRSNLRILLALSWDRGFRSFR